ncbi:MAG: rpoE leader peptide RseD [Leclercia sp.]
MINKNKGVTELFEKKDPQSNCLLTVQCLEWRFDNAWILGLGRHYLG